MKPGKAWIAMLLIPTLGLISLNAAAVSKSWNLPGLCTPTGTTTVPFKNNSLVTDKVLPIPYTNAPDACAGTFELVSVSAFADTGAGGLLQSAYIGDYGSGGLGATGTAGPTATPTGAVSGATNTNQNITTETTVQPDHALDNHDNKESILLSFNTAVSLTSFQIGYWDTDSDMTVLRYTGAGTPNLAARTYSNLTSNGWAVVGNYANVAPNSDQAVAGTSVTSSYWLISAYNSVFGGSLTNSNDYVKLLSIVANVPTTPPGGSVPEPSSLLLAAIALVALTALNRRRTV